MSDTLIVKVEDLCYQVDLQLQEIMLNPENIILGIYNYLINNDITIIYPNIYPYTLELYRNFFNRLQSAFNQIEMLIEEKAYIISYFQEILFKVDLSVIL